jgi:ferredoxin-NADP reductase
MVATVKQVRPAIPGGRVITLDVPGWPGNLAGQHIDVRLTAEDGYQAVRSYSLASVSAGSEVEIAVDQIPDGEVSPYLTLDVEPGDQMEVHGPLGQWFVWRPEDVGPVQLIGGGSGLVPLVAMARAHAAAASVAPFRMLVSVRSDDEAFYYSELSTLADPNLEVSWRFTRRGPGGWKGPVGRLDTVTLAASVFPPSERATFYVCGPTGFVETVARSLVELGHDPDLIRTERFGGS